MASGMAKGVVLAKQTAAEKIGKVALSEEKDPEIVQPAPGGIVPKCLMLPLHILVIQSLMILYNSQRWRNTQRIVRWRNMTAPLCIHSGKDGCCYALVKRPGQYCDQHLGMAQSEQESIQVTFQNRHQQRYEFQSKEWVQTDRW